MLRRLIRIMFCWLFMDKIKEFNRRSDELARILAIIYQVDERMKTDLEDIDIMCVDKEDRRALESLYECKEALSNLLKKTPIPRYWAGKQVKLIGRCRKVYKEDTFPR